MRFLRVLLLAALLFLMLLCAKAENAWQLPAEIEIEIDREYGVIDALEGYVELLNTPEGDFAFVLFVNDDIRILNAFEKRNGVWEKRLNSSAAVPQGEAPARLYTYEKGTGYNYNWDYKQEKNFVSDGLHIGISTDNGDTSQEGIEFVWRDGGFRLFGYHYNTGSFVDLVDGELVFWNISNGDERFVKATMETDIRLVAFYDLPRDPAQVVQDASREPVISEVKYLNRAFKLSPQEVKVKKNQRCEVFMGPGKSYGRAGGGKALVSTNDWIQVFARHDGWLLIQYGINDTRYRIGWIREEALISGQEVPVLPMQIYDIGTLLEDAELTDDPLSSKAKVLTVKEGTKVDIMAQLDDAWLYVQFMQDGKIYYGFLPVSVMRFDSNG